jgi:hypothetical protein
MSRCANVYSERDSGSHSQLFSLSDADNNSCVTKAIFVDDKYYSKGTSVLIFCISKMSVWYTVLQYRKVKIFIVKIK